MWRITLVLLVMLAACAPSGPSEPVQLRGFDGEVLEDGEPITTDTIATTTTSAIVASPVAAAPEDGWISPKFAQNLSVAGTNLTQYVFLSPYTQVPGDWTNGTCGARTSFVEAENDATIEAGVFRATNDGIRSQGAEGTILHANAVSFATLADTVGETYLDVFTTCTDDFTLDATEVRNIEGYGPVELVDVQIEDDHRVMRVGYMRRANIVMFLIATVDPADELIYDAFLDKAAEKLAAAVFEEEIGPNDFTPELLALEEELANTLRS